MNLKIQKSKYYITMALLVALATTAAIAQPEEMKASERASIQQIRDLKNSGKFKEIGAILKATNAKTHSISYSLALPRAASSKAHNLQAIADYLTAAIKCFPKSDQLYLARAEIWLKVDESELAEPDIRQAIALNPRSADAHADLAEFLRNQQKFKEALTEIEKAIEYGGPKDQLYDQKAEMHVQMFQINAAEQAYKEAIKYSDATRVWLPRQHLARMYTTSKRYNEGLAEFRAMGGANPKPEYRIEIATCLIGLGKYKEALVTLNADFPEEFNLNSHRLKKQCFMALKDTTRAKQEDAIIAKLSADF
ncbi:MAG: hypothetical protein WCT03_01380 [Candidatus Obscuribacterales bacterium]|jgi:tetratricopeptide (TPR) repeat protein